MQNRGRILRPNIRRVSEELINQSVIRRLQKVSGIFPGEDYQENSPSSDVLMNACLSRRHKPDWMMFKSIYSDIPLSLWSIMLRGKSPLKEKALFKLEESYQSAILDYQLYDVIPLYVVGVFKFEGLFGYGHLGILGEIPKKLSNFQIPFYDESFSTIGERVIFSLDSLFKTYEFFPDE